MWLICSVTDVRVRPGDCRGFARSGIEKHDLPAFWARAGLRLALIRSGPAESQGRAARGAAFRGRLPCATGRAAASRIVARSLIETMNADADVVSVQSNGVARRRDPQPCHVSRKHIPEFTDQ